MRHSAVKTTLDRYSHVDDEMKKIHLRITQMASCNKLIEKLIEHRQKNKTSKMLKVLILLESC